jgi:hypothetical protein
MLQKNTTKERGKNENQNVNENEYGSDAAISPLLLEQLERKEGWPDERQRSMDGVVLSLRNDFLATFLSSKK